MQRQQRQEGQRVVLGHHRADAPQGKEIYVGALSHDIHLSISRCDVDGGIDSVEVDPDSQLTWGPGMFDADPLFTEGPLGEFYLSSVEAGQSQDSPCIDAGYHPAGDSCFDTTFIPASGNFETVCLDQLATRTDLVPDSGTLDIGFHYHPETLIQTFNGVIAGPGPVTTNPPLVRVFEVDGQPDRLREFNAYGVPKYGVNVAAGDLDGDGIDEIITGAGPGAVFGPHVRGWDVDGGTASAMPGTSFMAYGTNQYGVNVTCGDVDGDGIAEIITAPGPSSLFGAHVRGFEPDGTATTGLIFFAWLPDTAVFGATIDAGTDWDGDGRNEILVGMGPDPDGKTRIRAMSYPGGDVVELFGSDPFEDLHLAGGSRVAAGVFLESARMNRGFPCLRQGTSLPAGT